ncbi:MAG: tetratricopeptide repeat protein [Thermodesulfobacteriota bacterium]
MKSIKYVFILFLLLTGCASVPVQTKNPRNPELSLPERAVIEGIKIKKGQSFTDCVEVSLEAVFEFYGTNINRKEISDQIEKTKGTYLRDMIAFVRKRGFDIFCFLDEEEEKRWIKLFLSQNMPLMVTVGYLGYGHMAVLVGYDDNKKIFYVADPAWRTIQEWRYQEFNEWHYKVQGGNEVFLVFPESKQIDALSGGKLPRELKKYSNTLGIANLRRRRYDRAISDFNKALEIEPNSRAVYNNRGVAYRSKDRYEEAISDFNKAIEISPTYALAYNNLAWLFATAKTPHFRDGKKAIELALKACDLTGYEARDYLGTLAAAYARAGDFENAVQWQEKAMVDIKGSQMKESQERLEFYKERKPWPPD